MHSDPSHRNTNLDCPTCHPSMNALIREAAYSHHVNSTIVCRISGKVMDDENYPLALPNGYVYSSEVSSADCREAARADRSLSSGTGTAEHGSRFSRRSGDLPTNGRADLVQPSAKGLRVVIC